MVEQLIDPPPPLLLTKHGWKRRGCRDPRHTGHSILWFHHGYYLKLTYLRFVYILDRKLLRWLLLPIILLLMSGTAEAEPKRGSSPRSGAVEVVGGGRGVGGEYKSGLVCVLCATQSGNIQPASAPDTRDLTTTHIHLSILRQVKIGLSQNWLNHPVR